MTFPTENEARMFAARAMTENSVAIIPTTHGYWVITTPDAVKQRPRICSICEEPFREYPCNPQPVTSGECCAYCDEYVVTPARMALMREVS